MRGLMRSTFTKGPRSVVDRDITGTLCKRISPCDTAELRHFTTYTFTRFLRCKVGLARHIRCRFGPVSVKGIVRRTLRDFTRRIQGENVG